MGYHKLTLARNCSLFLVLLFSLSGKLYAQANGPVAKIAYSASTFCSPGCVDFTDLSTGNPDSWSWQFLGSDSAFSFVQNPKHICYSTPGVYTVILTASNSAGSAQYRGQNIITVLDCSKPPVANFTMSDSSFCSGNCINFIDKSTRATTWSWSFPGGSPASSFDPSPTHICYSTPGKYTVNLTVSNDAGSDTRSRFQIIEVKDCNQPPVASFTPSLNGVCPGQCITFNNKSTNALSYKWSFSKNLSDTSTDTNPVKCYDSSGTYLVKLIAINAIGTSVDTMSVNILDCSSVAVPTAFSPNGDNKDDVLKVLGDKIKTINFFIYNRWGQLVFQTQDKTIGWNGTYKGAKQPVGVYEYHLDATLIDGTSLKKKGNITLLR